MHVAAAVAVFEAVETAATVVTVVTVAAVAVAGVLVPFFRVAVVCGSCSSHHHRLAIAGIGLAETGHGPAGCKTGCDLAVGGLAMPRLRIVPLGIGSSGCSVGDLGTALVACHGQIDSCRHVHSYLRLGCSGCCCRLLDRLAVHHHDPRSRHVRHQSHLCRPVHHQSHRDRRHLLGHGSRDLDPPRDLFRDPYPCGHGCDLLMVHLAQQSARNGLV